MQANHCHASNQYRDAELDLYRSARRIETIFQPWDSVSLADGDVRFEVSHSISVHCLRIVMEQILPATLPATVTVATQSVPGYPFATSLGTRRQIEEQERRGGKSSPGAAS